MASSRMHLLHALLGTIFFFFVLQTIPPANPLSFNFEGFKNNDLNLQGVAYLLRSEIQVTPNTMDQNNNYSVGRVTSHEEMHLWDKTTRKLTDFTTTFSFVIYSDQTWFGDGLAFFLADPNLPLLDNIVEGGGLGLVDKDQVLNSTQHSFVAVEFDTFHNRWDPNPPGIHVGMNFNSMKSNISRPWFPDMAERKSYNCSIMYNSSTFNLSVSFVSGDGSNNGKTVKKNIYYNVDLRDVLPEWVIFGFSAATGNVFEVHTLQSWSFSSSLGNEENLTSQIPPMEAPSIPSTEPEKQRKIGVLVGIGAAIGLALSFLGLFCFYLLKKIKGKQEEEEEEEDLNMDDEFLKGTGPKRFCYKDLVTATNNFSEEKKLGQGGFGGVYKGFLKESNSNVAIKRVSRESTQGIKEYATEVKIISKLRHRNLVQLIGWYHKKKDLLLIYEFMPNGSLDSHLYHGRNFLTWKVRFNIALGLASSLLYLHEEWEQCVLHRDIKSSNIMLDSNFTAKLGDFGLARLVDHEKGSQTTLIAGTRGYMAPEYVITGKAYKESDIYSFGVVLLEIASGRKAVDLKAMEGEISIVEWVWVLYGLGKVEEAADPKLCGEFDKKEMKCLVVVGLWCTYPDFSFRPSIRQVIKVLNFEAPLPVLPLSMPVPVYLPPTIKDLFSSVSSSFGAKC